MVARPRARMLAEIGIVAGIYAVLTWLLAPVSYGPLQLRIAEILKPLVIWEPHLIAAFVIGNFLSNLFSPFTGPWELLFMPAANLVGATVCYVIGRRQPYLGAAAYALIVGTAVATMLSVLLGVRFAGLLVPLVAGEALLIIGGVPIMRALLRAVAPTRKRWAHPGAGIAPTDISARLP